MTADLLLFVLVDNTGRQVLFGDLPIVHLFLHSAVGDKPVNVDRLGLPEAVCAEHRLSAADNPYISEGRKQI